MSDAGRFVHWAGLAWPGETTIPAVPNGRQAVFTGQPPCTMRPLPDGRLVIANPTKTALMAAVLAPPIALVGLASNVHDLLKKGQA